MGEKYKGINEKVKTICNNHGYRYVTTPEGGDIFLGGNKKYNVCLSESIIFVHPVDLQGSALIKKLMEIKI